MTDAASLTYMQRKALRRLGRGQTITGTMERDPIISQCVTRNSCPMPDADAGVAEWVDWEVQVRYHCQPRLNAYGRKLLKALSASNQFNKED